VPIKHVASHTTALLYHQIKSFVWNVTCNADRKDFFHRFWIIATNNFGTCNDELLPFTGGNDNTKRITRV
jgi:hypothetical protein